MFSDKNAFRLIIGGQMTVRRPKGSSRYDTKFTVKPVKHPDSVVIWGGFSGEKVRDGVYFLPKDMTIKGSKYLEILQDHLLQFWSLDGCQFLMHDGALVHKTKLLKR